MQVRIADNNQRLLKIIRRKYPKERDANDTSLVNQLLGAMMYTLLPDVKAQDDKRILKSIVSDILNP